MARYISHDRGMDGYPVRHQICGRCEHPAAKHQPACIMDDASCGCEYFVARLPPLPCLDCPHGIEEHGPFGGCVIAACACPGFRSEYDSGANP
jgi:hypothetical protein